MLNKDSENMTPYNKNGKGQIFSNFFKKNFNCIANCNTLRKNANVIKEYITIDQTPKKALNKLKFNSIEIKTEGFQSPKIVKGMHSVINSESGFERPHHKIKVMKQLPYNISQLLSIFRAKRKVSTNLLLDNIQLVKSTSKKDISAQKQEIFLKALNSFNERKFNISQNRKTQKIDNIMRLSGSNFLKANNFQRRSCIFDLAESVQ